MLHSLDRLAARAAARGLDEAEVYRDERNHRRRGRSRPTARRGGLLCPICGTRAARFGRFGIVGRRNAVCPGCGSLERHRFLWAYLSGATDLFRRRARVLHTAPEPCLETRFRALRSWRYRSVDRFDPSADLRADLRALPLDDGSVDLILSSHVLEHVPDDGPAIAEFARVLRPGGRAVIMVPADWSRAGTDADPAMDTPAKRLAAYGHPYHYRVYGRDLLDRLRAVGLEGRVVFSKRLLTAHRRRLWRINRNLLIDCRRVRSSDDR